VPGHVDEGGGGVGGEHRLLVKGAEGVEVGDAEGGGGGERGEVGRDGSGVVLEEREGEAHGIAVAVEEDERGEDLGPVAGLEPFGERLGEVGGGGDG